MRTPPAALTALCASACSLLIPTGDLAGEDDRTDGGDATESADAAAPDVSASQAGGWLPGFSYRRALRIDGARVAGAEDHEGFPVLVSIDGDARLRSATNGGAVAHAAGHDIAFAAADGLTPLPHEIERYVPESGRILAWVRIPRLATSSETLFHLYYGNADVVVPSERPADVWDDSYVGVWHLEETGGTRQDSSRRGNHLLESPAAVGAGNEARIGGSAAFESAKRHRLSISDAAQSGLDLEGPMTISYWVRATLLLDGYRNVVAKWESGADGPAANDAFYVANDVSGAGHRIKFNMEDATGSTIVLGRTSLALGAWHYVAAVYDGTAMQVFADGLADSDPTPRATGARNGNAAFDVGGKGSNLDYGHHGELDEVRVARVARSAAWLRTELDNQGAPSAFVGVGPEEERPAP